MEFHFCLPSIAETFGKRAECYKSGDTIQRSGSVLNRIQSSFKTTQVADLVAIKSGTFGNTIDLIQPRSQKVILDCWAVHQLVGSCPLMVTLGDLIDEEYITSFAAGRMELQAITLDNPCTLTVDQVVLFPNVGSNDFHLSSVKGMRCAGPTFHLVL